MGITIKKEMDVFDKEKLILNNPYCIYHNGEFWIYGTLIYIDDKYLTFKYVEFDGHKNYRIDIESVLDGKYRIVDMEEKKNNGY